jgi:hypothetical protein
MAQQEALAAVDLSMVLAPVGAHRMLHILDGLPPPTVALGHPELAAVAAAVPVLLSVAHLQTAQ